MKAVSKTKKAKTYDKKKLLEVVARGATAQEGANAFGVSISLFYKWIRDEGIKLNPHKNKSLRYAPIHRWIGSMGGYEKVKAKLAEGVGRGKNYTELMSLMGCSYSRIRALLELYGYEKADFTTDEMDTLNKYLSEGMGYAQIAGLMGKTEVDIRKALGEEVAYNKEARWVLGGEDLEKLKDGIERGLWKGEIMELMGYNYATLNKVLKANGLTLKRRLRLSEVDLIIAEMRGKGHTLQSIGDAVGMTREGVRISLVKQGLGGKLPQNELRRLQRPNLLVEADTLYGDKIIQELSDGKSFADLSSEWGVGEGVLRRLACSKGWRKHWSKSNIEMLEELSKKIHCMDDLRAVAKELGVLPESLYIRFHRRGVKLHMRNTRWNSIKLTPEELVKVSKEITSKKKLREVAESLGILPISLLVRFHRVGIKIQLRNLP